MPAAALNDLSDMYVRFAAKIGVITDADAERELPGLRGKEPKQIGQILVEKGVLHPNNFKLLESMFARQLTRMTHAIHSGETSKLKTVPVEAATKDANNPSTSAEPAPGLDPAKGDTTKLKGSAQATTRYRIVRPLTTSRLSELFVAEDVELHREVVLKRLQAKYHRSPGFRIRFNRTAEVASGLEHPCIPPIYNHGLDAEGRPYYTTRYLTGESFGDAVSRLHGANPADPPRSIDTKSPPEGLRRLLQRLLKVCDALSYAHHRGVVHCSLTPERVLLGKYGEVLVVGWGRAELIYGRRTRPSSNGAKARVLAAKEVSSGSRPPRDPSASRFENATPYTSPEQLTGDPSKAGILSDVYSLGALVFFTATGRPPFEVKSDDFADQLRQGLRAADLEEIAQVSSPLADLCAKAMAVDPMKRHASVREFAAHLDAWLEMSPGRTANAPSVKVAEKTPPQQKWSWALPASAAACLLVGATGGWFGRSLFGSAKSIATSSVAAASSAEASPNWLPIAKLVLAAGPEALQSTATLLQQIPAVPIAKQPTALNSVLTAAETALARHDDAAAAKRLQQAEGLVSEAFTNDPTSASRNRWTTAVTEFANQTRDRAAALATLERALAVADGQRRRAQDAWRAPTQAISEKLARLYAAQGQFGEAIKAADRVQSTADAHLQLERAEWLAFVGRSADAAGVFRSLVDKSTAPTPAASDGLAAPRALVGLAEQLLTLEKSPIRPLDDARKALSQAKSGGPETQLLLARLDAAQGAWLLRTGKINDAELSLKKATATWSKLPASKDISTAELLWASSAWDSLRQVQSAQQRLSEALASADRAASLLERVPAQSTVVERIDAVDGERGGLLVQLGKLKDAESAFTRIVDRGGAGAVNARYLRSACRLEQKDANGARKDAEELAKSKEPTARYLAARVFARLSGMPGQETTAAALADGRRSVVLLNDLSKSQFFTGDQANLPTTDSELEAVRQRPDFKEAFAATPGATATANPKAAP